MNFFLPSQETSWPSKRAGIWKNTHQEPFVVIKPEEHPIPKLIEEAESKYEEKLQRQSKSLEDAVEEYRRRYRRAPPKGFDEWWDFAQKHNVKMVDEYDGLMADLAPFFELSGEEVRRRAAQVGQLSSIDLLRIKDRKITIENGHGRFNDSEISARARGFRSMLAKFVKKLPDMEFPINAKAEGRVIVPWEHQRYPNLTLQNSTGGIDSMLGGKFKPDWGTDGNVWDSWRRTCPPDSPARRLYSSRRTHQVVYQGKAYLTSESVAPSGGYDFGFSPTTSSLVNYCDEPHSHVLQGHFFSDWRTIPALYPIFSPAKTRGFLDIRIPSHYYYGSTKEYTYGWDTDKKKLVEVDAMEVLWEDKIDKIFWRGATTGGGNHPPGFTPNFQRHRFLRMASDKSETKRTVLVAKPNSTGFVPVSVPIGQLNEEIMDAAFVKLTGEYPGGRTALMAAHRFATSVPLGKHWTYKYLVDMDGMSYSGRFLAFLASDSVPLKATVYDEFFSDWIQPWYHFIPLSPTYQEVYNIYMYFSGPTLAVSKAVNFTDMTIPSSNEKRAPPLRGDEYLRRIATAGKRWKKTIGRTLDMEVYVYRLCLEWARLWADDRDSMNFGLQSPPAGRHWPAKVKNH
ncbi:uncharacterized protein LACBIDRAFT_250899 [Laccaria bicolor S238N-H82]|uniref:Predicted protein n=1 Tax=Laccaria bicolor (strain S238N-H82 / ATCC MYA-4686) TaxID=486041 RepID=B0DFH6_LACBS|nr:uncharacterized protein LACBIDRAFT_250899 [Laccaria bicolor S238N-H82]EDR06864.1 predicted protein [Laccaria bicolor S238N-H82]|eukprot:XP_001882711.1 predicted protein [Laccaria bicolor S238N-H82]